MSPHIAGNDKFEFRGMVQNIRDDVKEIVETFFPESGEETDND